MSQNYIQVNGNTSGKGRSGVVKKLETGIERKRKKKKGDKGREEKLTEERKMRENENGQGFEQLSQMSPNTDVPKHFIQH